MSTTLAAMQSGNTNLGFVIAIDGYPYVISNEDEAAVQAAWASTDWATQTVIGGLTFDLDNHQDLNPWNPFGGGGRLVAKVQPDATDRLGIDMSRTDAGEETLLATTATRTSEIYVSFPDRFLTIGEAYCGTECFAYGFVSGGAFWQRWGDPPGSHRGKYVAHGVKNSVSTYGAVRFAEHHRVSVQDDGVRHKPVVSEQPRTWAGRRVSLWAHTKDPTAGTLNTKADALCLFLGELTEAQEESDTGHTSLLIENILDRVPKMMLGRDRWQAEVSYGIQLTAGQVISFSDTNNLANATALKAANDLTVVASDASGTNQLNAGLYAPEELVSVLNAWLGGEVAAGRIHGNYTITCPEDVSGSPRTVVHFFIPGATNQTGAWTITWPFPGFARALGNGNGTTMFAQDSCGDGHAAPFPEPMQPLGFAWPDSGLVGVIRLPFEHQTGTFVANNNTLPALAKAQIASENPPYDYGIFMLECDTPMMLLGTIVGNELRRVRVLSASFGFSGSGYEALSTATIPVGSAPPRLRQIPVHEAPVKTFLKWLFYSTGTQGYNHPDFDILPHGQGLGIPYDVLGDSFENSCDALPVADQTVTVTLETARTVADVFASDLVIRNAHLVFREGKLKFVSLTTPSAANVTISLDESNKAEPIDTKISHRPSMVLDSSWVRNLVKINYNRDIGKAISSGEDSYSALPLEYEDATSIDDMGGIPKPVTLDLRNVYNDTDQIGQGVRKLAAGLIAWMAFWGRPLWKMRRSIAPTLFEGFGIGDTPAVTDDTARDPTTGARGINTRPAIVVGHHYKIQTGQAGTKIKFSGEVDLMFMHNDRVFAYAPAAEVDETANTGGFTAGYDGVRTLKFKAHEHSESTDSVDLAGFALNYNVLIIEIDPDDPANPDYWRRSLTSVDTATGQAVVDSALASPAFSSSKRYRMIFDSYASDQTAQHLKSFQSGATKTIQEQSPPDQYGAQGTSASDTTYDSTTTPEFIANLSYGPNLGAGRDCGYDKEIALLLEAEMDQMTRRSSPRMASAVSTYSSSSDGWQLLRVEPIFLGGLLYNNQVNRNLYVSPYWRSTGITPAQSVQLRVWLSGYLPSGTGNLNLDNATPGYSIKSPAASCTWTLMSSETSFEYGVPQPFRLGNLNGHQWGYLIVEGTRSASLYGLSRASEGERFTPWTGLLGDLQVLNS